MFFNKKEVTTKKWHLALIAIIILGVIGIKIYSLFWPTVTVKIGGQQFSVLVANTTVRGIEGWSNKKTMGKYGGMIFPFATRGVHTMVMRDMMFPLDIVWLDNGIVVDIAPNLTPENDHTEAQLTPYFARLPSNAVLELPAGFATQNGLKIGDKLEIVR